MDQSSMAPHPASGSLADLVALVRRRDLAVVALLMVATSLSEGIGLLALVPILADLDGTRQRPAWLARVIDLTGGVPPITALIAGVLAIAIARTLLAHLQTVRTARIDRDLIDRLRIASFAGVIRAEWRWLAQARAADLSNLIVTNVNQIGYGLTSVLNLFATAIVAATYVATAMLLSWRIAVLTFVVGGLVLVAFAGQRRRALALGAALGSSRAAFHGFVQQGFAGVRLIKANSTEDARIAEFETVAARVSGQIEQYERSSSLGQRLLQIGGLIVLAVIVWIGYVVLRTAPSTLLPLLLVFARLVPLVGAVQQHWSGWLHVHPMLVETRTLLAETARVREPVDDPARAPLTLRSALTLDRISVTYAGRSAAALEDVSLTLAANTTTAVFGSSGAGKSTLADVLMGLIAPDAGTLAVDGRVIDGGDRVHWRRSLAYVQQDSFLFHDSVRANLQLGRTGIDDEAMRDALTRAGASFALDLPGGLDTVVGDGGVRLSGGERQRIALARALIGRPQLLVLDEATSALDPDNERAVRTALKGLRGTVTLLFISHRRSMWEDADQVVAIEAGRLRMVAPQRPAATEATG